MSRELFYLLIPLSCLVAALVSGFLGSRIGRVGAHRAASGGVGFAFVLSCGVAWDVFSGNHFNGPVYTWAVSGGTRFEIGFLIAPLSAVMMVENCGLMMWKLLIIRGIMECENAQVLFGLKLENRCRIQDGTNK